MSKVIKAKVISGRYSGQIIRITNISTDESGRKTAACFLSDGSRANINVSDLSVIEPIPEPVSEVRRAQTSSMPFVSGSSSSRTLTHTKNMSKTKRETRSQIPSTKVTAAICEFCGSEYNLEDRKGMPGKITDCESCAEETQNKVEGKMIFSHKTGATIEIKKDGELLHQADTFDPKNKN